MCQQRGLDFFGYESNKPGFHEDLPFTPVEFSNASWLVQDGPFEDDNANWTRLVRMYNRMITLRIDVVQYCEDVFPEKLLGSPVYRQFIAADSAHRTRAPLPFELPFSAQEFLSICDELTQSERVYERDSIDLHAGSDVLFFRMVQDLATHRINLVDFLADHIPADMEKDPYLLRLLAAAQGPHAQKYELNVMQFMVSCLKTPRPGRVVGPLSHFQAAMFVQTLEELDAARIPDHHTQMVTGPHSDCNAVADGKFVLSPCCRLNYSECCIMRRLMIDGPRCQVCGEDLIEVRKAQLRKQ